MFDDAWATGKIHKRKIEILRKEKENVAKNILFQLVQLYVKYWDGSKTAATSKMEHFVIISQSAPSRILQQS